jgi:hypothetical protein
VDNLDFKLPNLTYQQFVAGHRAPPASEVALAGGLQVEKIQVAWRRLHDMHDLVLNPDTLGLRMANSFSAVPTAYRLSAPATVRGKHFASLVRFTRTEVAGRRSVRIVPT